MASLFPPVDPEQGLNPNRKGKRRPIPLRMIIPNMVTLLSLCAGLTAIRMTFEERYEIAIYAIFAAAILDSLDGRIARYLRSTSKFGAELDSLSDFLSFGCAPPILLYGWNLHSIKSFGWLAVIVFAIAGALRLARFNVMLNEEKPSWQANFFVGMPIPAGALVVLLPIYLDQIGITVPPQLAPLVVVYVIVIAALMVSRVPTFSGKKLGRIRREYVLPLMLAVVLFFALLASFPFEMLAAISVAYLAYIPFGWRAWNRLARAHGDLGQELSLDVTVPDEDETGPADKS
ncbi:CDP-diacylglycerol--serine O-phosphatidyltransferase [Oryzibacter oryziterrae]|uniref:CDP-diacylglycerol--serine O-phosphatidyltransferase n=1 Tax=Oryzibacter oryziterrae TaxID=2766474 RepID=UPI001F02B547|nr:CDP-diacylglycerol--serine O-phosphatidyltransferase [Oryzibacter oryziterrae]